jgi:opacity protein-like surface antigen
MSKKFLAMVLGAMTAHGDGFEVGVSTGVSMNGGGQAESINNAYDATKNVSRYGVNSHFITGLTDQDIDTLKAQALNRRADLSYDNLNQKGFVRRAQRAAFWSLVGYQNADLLADARHYTGNKQTRAQELEQKLGAAASSITNRDTLFRAVNDKINLLTNDEWRVAGIGGVAARYAIEALDQKDQKNPGNENEAYQGTSVGFASLNRAAGVPVRLDMGYGFNLGRHWFAGAHGFVGLMGGSTSSEVNVQVDQQTVAVPGGVGPTSINVPGFSVQNKMVVSPELNMGLGAKFGYNFNPLRMFVTGGWTIARMKGKLHDELGVKSTQNQWKNGLFAGGGFDYALSETTRVGLGYTATFFGKTDWDKLGYGGWT